MALRLLRISNPLRTFCQIRMMSGDQQPGWGSGAGKGGGSGGAVRDAGGAFGKRESALEEEYFRRQTSEQLQFLHEHHHEEIENLNEKINQHQEAIQRHKKKLADLKKMTEGSD